MAKKKSASAAAKGRQSTMILAILVGNKSAKLMHLIKGKQLQFLLRGKTRRSPRVPSIPRNQRVSRDQTFLISRVRSIPGKTQMAMLSQRSIPFDSADF